MSINLVDGGCVNLRAILWLDLHSRKDIPVLDWSAAPDQEWSAMSYWRCWGSLSYECDGIKYIKYTFLQEVQEVSKHFAYESCYIRQSGNLFPWQQSWSLNQTWCFGEYLECSITLQHEILAHVLNQSNIKLRSAKEFRSWTLGLFVSPSKYTT